MTADQSRWIAHLDMDAFFASVELLRYPELTGLPVVVGGRSVPAPQRLADGRWRYMYLRDYVGRGVVTTSTYPARLLGVFSAMGLMQSAQLAPDAVLLPADFASYRHYSRLFKQAVADIAPAIEDRGIDEIYIELAAADAPASREQVVATARVIQAAVGQATGLSCSIGLAPNKLLAKIASDLDKPGGLTVLTADSVPQRVWPLPVSRINGIGPKATAKLRALGIETIGQLAASPADRLQTQFGARQVAWMLTAAQGRDDRPVVTWSAPKSISRETTFERDLHVVKDRDALSGALLALCDRVAADMAAKNICGRTMGLKLRFDDFRIVTRDLTLPAPTREAAAILQGVRACLRRVTLDRRIRLLGVRVTGLVPADQLPAQHSHQLTLY